METKTMVKWILGGTGIAILVSQTVQNLILQVIQSINAPMLQWIGIGMIVAAIAMGK